MTTYILDASVILNFLLGQSASIEKKFVAVLKQVKDGKAKFFSSQISSFFKNLPNAYFLKASFYDTSYHVLAKLLKGDFITCDIEYFKKAKELGKIKSF